MLPESIQAAASDSEALLLLQGCASHQRESRANSESVREHAAVALAVGHAGDGPAEPERLGPDESGQDVAVASAAHSAT